MKIKKSVDMSEGRCQDLLMMFKRKLIETCGENTVVYKNNMESYKKWLDSWIHFNAFSPRVGSKVVTPSININWWEQPLLNWMFTKHEQE